MITQGILSAGSDYSITSCKNMLVATGLFSVISDTGSGTSHVIKLKYLTNLHVIKLSYSAGNLKFELMNLADSASLNGNNIAPDSIYKILVNGNTFAFIAAGTFIIGGSTQNTNEFLIYSVGGYNQAFLSDSDTGRAASTENIALRNLNMEQIMLPCFLKNAAATYLEIDPIDNIFTFPNSDTIANGTVVNISTDQYIVTTLIGSSSVKLLIKS